MAGLLGIIFFSCLLSFRAQGQDRQKILDMDSEGNLYLYSSALLCKNEIIKRLTEGTYLLAEPITLGLSNTSPAVNCRELKLKVPSVKSGVYWIDPDRGSHGNAFQAYCDQETEGGGWTLVWSYTFTDYANFGSGKNAVTPRPNWPTTQANTRVSVTPPLSETHYEAVDFGVWRKIGNQTLIKSNINNWIVCHPGGGSLVHYKAGPISCRIAKDVSQSCPDVVPGSIAIYSRGPSLDKHSHGYYFDGDTRKDWPTHDPCGGNQANQLRGISNPHGSIFVR